MKKLLFVWMATSAILFSANSASAQQPVKIGYFDEQQVLGLMPGIDKVSQQIESFQQDSLKDEYDWTYKSFMRQDSSFKKDSAGMPPKVREMALAELNKNRQKLVYWQQYSQEALGQKQEQLLQPFRVKILSALNEVIAEQKYTLVLKSDALSPYVNPPLLDNLALRVAIKLKLQLPKEAEDAWKAAGGTGLPAAAPAAPKAPAAAPKPKA
ncbi:MAG: OmpH family outer membrane protein [Bacteroidetes bacterium]|nr:OmpH family outer membrane protein [Bacteroidota bacterium]